MKQFRLESKAEENHSPLLPTVAAEFFPQSDMADILASGGGGGVGSSMVNGASPFSAAAAATSAFSASSAMAATSVANSSDLKMHPLPKEDSEEDSKAGLLGCHLTT